MIILNFRLWQKVTPSNLTVKPRLHQGNMLRGRATCCRQQATCAGCCRAPATCCLYLGNMFATILLPSTISLPGNMLPWCKRGLTDTTRSITVKTGDSEVVFTPGHALRGRATCCRQQATCCLYLGNMHPCIQHASNRLATNWQQFCWRQQATWQHVALV